MELMKKVGKRSDNSSQHTYAVLVAQPLLPWRETASKGLATNTWKYSNLGSQIMSQRTQFPHPPLCVYSRLHSSCFHFRRVSRASSSALDRAADAGHRSPGFLGQLTSIAKSPRSLPGLMRPLHRDSLGGFTGTETLYSHLQALLVSSQAAGSKSHL